MGMKRRTAGGHRGQRLRRSAWRWPWCRFGRDAQPGPGVLGHRGPQLDSPVEQLLPVLPHNPEYAQVVDDDESERKPPHRHQHVGSKRIRVLESLRVVAADVRTTEHVKQRVLGQSQGDYSQEEAARPDGQDPDTDPGFPPLGLERESDGLEALHADADQREQLDAAAQGVSELLQGAHGHRHPVLPRVAQEGEEQQRRVHGALEEVAGGQADQQRVVARLQALGPGNNPTDPQVSG